MRDETQEFAAEAESFEDLLAECISAEEAGRPVDRERLINRYPQFATDLAEFFANREQMHRLAAPLLVGNGATELRGSNLGSVRYFGDYELLEEIAHGGMGVVYKARQTSLNRLVAVKMILAGQFANEGEVKRFQAEAEAAANLHHPGVVGIYEVGINAGQHYYSMEYVQGHDLAAVQREKPVSVHQAALYLREIAEIVEFAHSQGVLHRDLKPSNILIDPSGRLRVTDFGLAKRVQSESDLTITGQVLGTPSYMSPEQAAAQHAVIGPASDVYSLGVILYELLTGRPPFRSDSIGETLRQVQQEEPVQPRLLNPKLPRDLETICLKCLEKETRRRYTTSAQLVEELGRFLRGEPILARPIGPVARLGRWFRRQPALAALAGTTLIVILLLVAIAITARFGYTTWNLAEERKNENERLACFSLIADVQKLALQRVPDFRKAEQALTIAIARHPQRGDLFRERAHIRYELQDLAGALADSLHARSLGDTDAALDLLLVAIGRELGDDVLARSEATQLAARLPNSLEAALAQAITEIPDRGSLQRLQKAFAGQPAEMWQTRYRGLAALRILQYQGTKPAYDQAVRDFLLVQQSRPADARARQSLCLAWIHFDSLADLADSPLALADKALTNWQAEQVQDWRPQVLRGLWHWRQEEYQQAQQVCEQGCQRFPDRPEFPQILAWALREQKLHPAAEAALLKAQELLVSSRHTLWPISQLELTAEQSLVQAPSKPQTWHTQLPKLLSADECAKWHYRQWWAVTKAQATLSQKEGAQWCARWENVAPDCPGPFEVVLRSVDNGTPYDAIISRAPSARAARLERGAVLTKISSQQALTDYEVYLQLRPQDPRGMQYLGSLLTECTDRSLRDLPRGYKLVQQATLLAPHDARVWYHLSRMERYRGDHAAALLAIERALAIDSQNEYYRFDKARILMELGDPHAALRLVDDVVRESPATDQILQTAAEILVFPPSATVECGERAVELMQQSTVEPLGDLHSIALFRAGRWCEAGASGKPAAGFFRAMILWRTGDETRARAAYVEAAHQFGAELTAFDHRQRQRTEIRAEAARMLGYDFDHAARQRDVATRQIRPGDYSQLGGWGARNNISDAGKLPDTWAPGNFDRKTGQWQREKSENIKWVAKLGSQTYGNPVAANGVVLVGTNNTASYLKQYPADVDLGCLLCFRETDGEFLWQYSSEKLPTGRTHDWPLMGICSSPLVEGDRAWLVTNRGKLICLDTAGFRDNEDDGAERGIVRELFQIPATRAWELGNYPLSADLIEELKRIAGPAFLDQATSFSKVVEPDQHWKVWQSRVRDGRWVNASYYFTFQKVEEKLHCQMLQAGTNAPLGQVVELPFELYPAALTSSAAIHSLDKHFLARGVTLPEHFDVQTLREGAEWSFQSDSDQKCREYTLKRTKYFLVCSERTLECDPVTADLVWELDLMRELGVSQHNMCTCPPTAWGDTLFICTSNGVAEDHIRIPAPQAPSFIAVDKHSGRLLWSDNSPGANIHHGQWSGPAVGMLGGVPQVIFPGGDGWIYSFHAEDYADGKPQLLWKFDVNPKDAQLELGGRGTRNETIAMPVIYDGRVYVSDGQDPEHGEGQGHLWCLDPTRRGDISRQLVVDINDRNRVIPHRRVKAALRERGEIMIDNPNSGVVWRYEWLDRNGDREQDFEEVYHRSLSSVAIKDDLLITADYAGLIHCLNAKTGQHCWHHDSLAAIWGSPLIVGDRAIIGDEDGDIMVFPFTPYARHEVGQNGAAGVDLLAEINMNNSVYSTPIFAGKVLYIANKDHLFAIVPTNAPATATKAASD